MGDWFTFTVNVNPAHRCQILRHSPRAFSQFNPQIMGSRGFRTHVIHWIREISDECGFGDLLRKFWDFLKGVLCP